MKVVHRLYHSQKFTPQGIASLHIETMEQLLYPGRFNEKEWVKVLDEKAQVTISKIQTTFHGEAQSLDMQKKNPKMETSNRSNHSPSKILGSKILE